MANYKKYAENLIGNWEKDIYEPQKQVTKDIYNTNWNQLVNSYNDVRDKLARNFELARMDYSNTLNNIQDESFNRMASINADLATRGLSSSGMLDRISQGDTTIKGEVADKALANLLAQNNASIESLGKGVIGLGQEQTNLASDLAGDIGKLTEADAANNQALANLIAGIGEGAARRAASRAGSGSKSLSKLQKENDELERRMLIVDTLSSTELDDETKYRYLNNYLDVPIDTAKAAVTAYNNNKILSETNPKIQDLQSKINSQTKEADAWRRSGIKLGTPLGYTYAGVMNVPNAMSYWDKQKLNNLQNKVDGLNYTDLYDLLYGGK